jgi:biopolymer transport protein TolR
MAFGRLERSTGPQPMSDINMTPLIDVMLVLLVIFMIAAPLMGSSLKLDLPATPAARAGEEAPSLVLTLDAQGRLQVAGETLDAERLRARLEAEARQDPLREVQLRADKAVPYGRVIELIGLLQQAGLTRIAFVAEPVTPASP